MTTFQCMLCKQYDQDNMQSLQLTNEYVHTHCLNEYVWRQTGCDCTGESDTFVCPQGKKYSFEIIDDEVNSTRVDITTLRHR